MAEGFEAYHVPQQSRRDKLRVAAEPTTNSQLHGGSISQHHQQQPYDHHHHNHQNQLMMMMSIGGGGSSSSDVLTCQNHNLRSPYYLDPGILYGASPQIAHSDAVLAFKPEPLTLSLSSYGNENSVNNNSSNNNFAIAGLGSVPVGAFAEYYNNSNYPSVLRGSRFMRPAQQLLEELCYEVVGDRVLAASAEKLAPDAALMMMQTNAIVDDDHHHDIGDIDDDDDDGDDDGVEIRKRKSRLISMLDEVYRRYKQYYQQMQAVVTSFECVGNAAPYANLAVKAMTRHFRYLKNVIMDQLQFANKDNISVHTGHGKGGVYTQIRPIIHSSSSIEHHQPVWRPQRGLPERAVTVLRAWLFEHFLHPYPTDTDKMVLAKQTGLTRSQVSNWFINARVRLWKPMVEEIYMLETRQGQPKGTERGDQNEEGNPANRSNNDRIANSVASSTSTDRVENPTTAVIASTTLKRSRAELPNLPVDVVNFTYGGLETMSMAGGGNGVSLTLGLQQDNHGICLAEPSFSINAAHRFGLGLEGSGSEGYGMSAFEVQNRHFGRDMIGGQLLHDFVG